MGWMKRIPSDSAELHMKTAELLLTGARESFDLLDMEEIQGPENSRESVIRRLVQVRQELLMVIKELR